MKKPQFFASMLATFLFFISFTAFATDPIKSPTGGGKSSTTVNVAQVEELGSFVRQNALSLSLSPATNTVRYESPTYFLDGNDLATNVSVIYSLSSGNVESLFIITKNRTGQQTFNIFPYKQENNEMTGSGALTSQWIVMELNRVGNLTQPNHYIQSTDQLNEAQPVQTTGKSSQKPAQTARSGSNKTQR